MEDFQPLPEGERLRLQKQRQRSNKISKIMGDYLLKGYKMLGTSCNKCQAVLLRDRQGEDYCVGCVEVDDPSNFHNDVTQRIPTTSTSSARTELETRSSPTRAEASNDSTNHADTRQFNSNEKQILERSIDCIFGQIAWANNCLGYTDTNLEQRTQLVSFIKNCYETVDLLKKHR